MASEATAVQPESEEETLTLEDLLGKGLSLKEARKMWIAHCEKKYLQDLFRLHSGTVSDIARAAKIDRINCYRLLWKHGLLTRKKK